MQTFCHGLISKRQQPHKIEWSFFYLVMCHPSIHCCLCGLGQTWRPLFKLQRRDDLPYDPQRIGPKTPVHCNKATAGSITNYTIKRQFSQLMEMRYSWVCDKIAQNAFDVRWHPGQENLADYHSKHHIGTHHKAVSLWYLHTDNSFSVLPNSFLVLPRANRPSTLNGCVGTLPKEYICYVPLPPVPLVQSTESRPQIHTIPDYYKPPYVVPMYSSLCSLVENAAYAFSPAWHAIAVNT
jgi:hypothetical protein